MKKVSIKKWFVSRTIIANLVAGIALVIANETGNPVPPDVQALLVMVGNIILRALTKEAISL